MKRKQCTKGPIFEALHSTTNIKIHARIKVDFLSAIKDDFLSTQSNQNSSAPIQSQPKYFQLRNYERKQRITKQWLVRMQLGARSIARRTIEKADRSILWKSRSLHREGSSFIFVSSGAISTSLSDNETRILNARHEISSYGVRMCRS